MTRMIQPTNFNLTKAKTEAIVIALTTGLVNDRLLDSYQTRSVCEFLALIMDRDDLAQKQLVWVTREMEKKNGLLSIFSDALRTIYP